ncbi:MAG: hypothetical protein VB853_05890 [Pirellulales bacterium]
MEKRQSRFSSACLTAVVLIGLCAAANAQGLSGFVPKNALNIFKHKRDSAIVKAPRRIVSLWSDTVLHQSGRQSTRGLAGRIYFYDEKHKAVKVEGALVVYAFDDRNGVAENRPADRKYIFTREQLPAHFSLSDFGPSYSIWLPWDVVAGEQKQLSLVAVFRGKQNNVIVGQMARHVLPGATPPPDAGPPQIQFQNVRTVSYDEPINAVAAQQPIHPGRRPATTAAKPQPGIRATTIALPPSTQRRISIPSQTTPRERTIPGRDPVKATGTRPWLNPPEQPEQPQGNPPIDRSEQTGRPAPQNFPQLNQPTAASHHRPAASRPVALPASLPAQAAAQPSGHFLRPRFRPQATPAVPPTRGPQASEPRRSEPQFGQPQTLQSRQAGDQ